MAVADEKGVPMPAIDPDTLKSVTPLSLVCSPAGAKGSQVEDIACNYFAAHPENREMPSVALINLAQLEVWPCGKK